MINATSISGNVNEHLWTKVGDELKWESSQEKLLGITIDKNLNFDGLAIFKNTSGPMNERIKKEFQKIFQNKGLDIVIQCNQKVVDYLDVTLNLNDGTHRPYRKPGDETKYIHSESDHPPNILKQLPISVEKRISDLSSSEEIFNQAKQYYQNALINSGHDHVLQYKPVTETRRRNRKRNITWFNPPFSKTVTTNVGKKFLSLLDKHFPRNHKFRKIFNRNTVKVSYGCMPNVGTIINAHNKKVLDDRITLEREGCNCRARNSCPLNGECLTKNVVYEATINSNLRNYREKVDLGITKNTFKTRYGNHKTAFNNFKYHKDTELSKEVWRIRGKGEGYNISWRIVRQHPDYNQATKRCALCLNEK